MVKRIAIGLSFSWLALALIYCFLVGPSARDLLAGLALPPKLVAELLRPGRPFAGLDHPQAVSLLRQAFGEGVTPADGRVLHDLVVARGCKHGLDLGTARGYAALWIALAMARTGGRLVTIEIDSRQAAEARRNFRRAGLEAGIDSRINDALAEIPALTGEFDFVFLDLGAPLNLKVLELLAPRIPPGGALVAHNAIFLKSTQPGYLEALRPDFDTTAVPTLSGGIAVSIKTLR